MLDIGTPRSFSDAIDGLNDSNELDLLGLPFVAGATASISGTVLSVESGGVTDTPNVYGLPAGTVFKVADDGSAMNGTRVFTTNDYGNTGSPPCYCRGTRILTDRGEVAVEDLSIGDRVVTHSGETRPIKWIGNRGYNSRFLAANPQISPIRFVAGSLGNALPRRDLMVSPEHAMFLDGVLIPARCLVNGSTITRWSRLDQVEYFHIELDMHDVILAEGTPSETFVDDDSRGMFHNAHEFTALYPDTPRQPVYCARRVEQGAELEAVRRRVAAIVVAAWEARQRGEMQAVLFTVLAGLFAAGCALSTGIVPVGPDTYVLSEMRAPVRGGGAEAQRVVLARANEFCQQQGREVFLLDVRPDGDPRTIYWPTAFDATFQCHPLGHGR